MGEVLVTHHELRHRNLNYPDFKISLFEKRVKAAIEIAERNRWPVILHLEFNDMGEEKAPYYFKQLYTLLEVHAGVTFGLIHMGQVEPHEARALLERHDNIFFLTSHADPITQRSLANRAPGVVAQTGWINLFERGARWKKPWRKLVEQYPDRFVLAFDNVWAQHWKQTYEKKVRFWRKALAQLSNDAALRIGCANAARLWTLDVDCR